MTEPRFVKLVLETSGTVTQTTPAPLKPRTRPCYVCGGFGSRASDEPYMMMHTETCTYCNGTGKLDMYGRTLETPSVRP